MFDTKNRGVKFEWYSCKFVNRDGMAEAQSYCQTRKFQTERSFVIFCYETFIRVLKYRFGERHNWFIMMKRRYCL